MLTPCEEWENGRKTKGYGQMRVATVEGKQLNIAAHRLIWMQHHGHTDLDILHECDNPPCINMAHLRAGTKQDNVDDKMKRGRHNNSKKTHCPQGHEYSEANTYRWRTSRQCKTCKNQRNFDRRTK